MMKRLALSLSIICVYCQSCAQDEQTQIPEWVLYDLHSILTSISERQGTLPECVDLGPEDEVLHSWRMEVALHISEMSSYLEGKVDTTLPWWHDRHAALRHSSFSGNFGVDGSQFTQIVAISGDDTGFGHDLKTLPECLVLLLEWRSSRIPWYEPFDLDVDSFPKEPGATMEDVVGTDFRVLFADGSVRRLSKEIPVDTFLKYVSISSAADQSIDGLATWGE